MSSSAAAAAASNKGTVEKGNVEKVEGVQVDGLVALKVIKHCQEEGSSSDLVTGILVGLVVGTTLEITNCFPMPKEWDEPGDESKYQVSILRKLRDINMDYHHVGWYQSTYLGSHVTKEFLDSHIDYQRSIEESVVLIYDPLRTNQGNLRLRAYRLAPVFVDMKKDDGKKQEELFTPESVVEAHIDHTNILVELPVTLRNSRLMNSLLCELDTRNTKPDRMDFLGLSASQILQKNMQLLTNSVESLQQDTYRLLGYEKQLAKNNQAKQQLIQKKKEENMRRAQRGDSPLPLTDEALEQELTLKPVAAPSRLEALLIGQQVDLRCKQVTEVAAEAFTKLYMSEGLQAKKQ